MKAKNFFSFMLAVLLVIASISLPASANESVLEDKITTATTGMSQVTPIVSKKVATINSVQKLQANALSPSVSKLLENKDIPIRSNTTVEVLPLEVAGITVNALSITNVDENGDVSKDTLIEMQENDGTLAPVNLVAQGDFYGDASYSWSYTPSSLKTVTVKATAKFNMILGDAVTLYQPLGVSFVVSGSTKPSSVSAQYTCDGKVYSYPGMTDLGYSDVYAATKTVSNPSFGTTYTYNKTYSSTKALRPFSGSVTYGNFIGVEIVYGGKSYPYTVSF